MLRQSVNDPPFFSLRFLFSFLKMYLLQVEKKNEKVKLVLLLFQKKVTRSELKVLSSD